MIDIYHTLSQYNLQLTVSDPWADVRRVKEEYDIELHNDIPSGPYDAVILAVSHAQFEKLDISSLLKPQSVVYDVKAVLDRRHVDGRL